MTPLRFEGDIELYEVELGPGEGLRSDPHKRGTREIVTVIAGRVVIESGSESVSLEQGDTVSYRADLAHAILNDGETKAVALLVDTYDERRV